MKIRIKGNTIRLRLTKTEVENFKNAGWIGEHTDFGSGNKLSYALQKADCKDLSVSLNNGNIVVSVPDNMATVWTNTEMVSLENQVDPTETSTLKILVEKDFACLKAREGEDESDMFPHPEEDTLNC